MTKNGRRSTVCAVMCCLLALTATSCGQKKDSVGDNKNALLLIPERLKEGVVSPGADARIFALKIKAGEAEMAAGEFDAAIKLYNEALVYVRFNGQKSMIYERLANVYSALGDANSEYQAIIQARDFTNNVDQKKRLDLRANEIKPKLRECPVLS